MCDCVTEAADGSGRIDAIFDVLRNPYRRYLCQYVLRTDADAATCEELADYVLDRAPESLGNDLDRQRVEIELRHSHLPKVAAAGLVEYDRRSGAVRVDRETTAKRLEQARRVIAELQNDRSDRQP